MNKGIDVPCSVVCFLFLSAVVLCIYLLYLFVVDAPYFLVLLVFLAFLLLPLIFFLFSVSVSFITFSDRCRTTN